MDELTREFLIESQEGLDRMERCLTELETRPQDTGLLADIFRSVHTIKGTTGFLGFKRLEKLAHAGENLLGLLRDGKLAADRAVITGLLQLLDGLRSILKIIEAEGGEGEGIDTELIERLMELQALGCTNPREAADGRGGGGAGGVARTGRCRERRAGCGGGASGQKPAIEVPMSKPKAAAAGAAAGGTAGSTQGTMAESTLRVDVTLLNRMMNLVGELVLTRNQVLQATAADPQHDDAFAAAGHGDGGPARERDEGAHAAGVEHLFQDAADRARSLADRWAARCGWRWRGRTRSSTRACWRRSRTR